MSDYYGVRDVAHTSRIDEGADSRDVARPGSNAHLQQHGRRASARPICRGVRAPRGTPRTAAPRALRFALPPRICARSPPPAPPLVLSGHAASLTP